jgi:hypothetical protein
LASRLITEKMLTPMAGSFEGSEKPGELIVV